MLRTSLIVSMFALAACGTDVPRPRIAEVETTCHFEFGRTSKRLEVTYDDDQIDEISVSQQSDYDWDTPRTSAHTLHFSYSDNQISAVSLRQEDETADLVFSYDDGLLQSSTGTWCEERECETSESSYWYFDGRLTSEDRIEDGVMDESWEYDWSGEQLREITNSWGDEGAFESVHFAYQSDGELQRATASDNEFVSYRFNDGRLSSASSSNGERWEIAYDADDLVMEIVHTWLPGRCATQYTYDDGEVAGIVPVPALPHGNMFDMAGQTQRDYQVLTTELFID